MDRGDEGQEGQHATLPRQGLGLERMNQVFFLLL